MGALRLLFLILITFAAEGRDTITWLQADLTPYYIQHGQHRDKGSLQRAQLMLTQKLPGFEHKVEWDSLVRREQRLSQDEPNLCSFAMVKTADRGDLHYSTPVAVATGYAVITLADSPLSAKLATLPAETNVVDWVAAQPGIVGLIEAGRAMPDIVRRLPASQLMHFPLQVNPIILLQRGRADYLIEYPARASYLGATTESIPSALHFKALSETEVNLSYVACSKTTSDSVMMAINNAIAQIIATKEYRDAIYAWSDSSQLVKLQALYQQYIATPLHP